MTVKVSKTLEVINQDIINAYIEEIRNYIFSIYGPTHNMPLLQEDLSLISVIFEYDYDVDINLIKDYIVSYF